MSSADPGEDATMPRVSVIVRTRNRPEMLADAVADILAQDFSDVEIVVVDDGDDPSGVASVVAAADPSGAAIRIVDHTARVHGRAAAANAGIAAARGDLLVWHDDDDSWHPSFLSTTVGYLDAHPDVVAVSARVEIVVHRVDETGQPVGEDRGPLEPERVAITVPDMLRANRVTTNSLLYRARVHDDVGVIDESLHVHEDWEFYLRLLARYPIELLPGPPLAHWHHRPGGTGDGANSIVALGAEHETSPQRIRDAFLRESIARHGIGTAMLMVTELSALEERMRERAERFDAARAADAAADAARAAALERQLYALESSVTQLRTLVHERTSVSLRIRALRARLTRR